MEEIETFPGLWLSAVSGWSQEHGLDSGQQCKVMSGSSGPCSVFTLHDYTLLVTLLCVLLSYSHKESPNGVSIIIELKQALVMKGHIAQNSGEQLPVLCMSMLYAWSDDAGAEWSRDSAAAICNVSSPSQCPVCPGPGSHYRSLLSSAPRHSFSRHILDCGGGQGMVTGQVTGTTHCT